MIVYKNMAGIRMRFIVGKLSEEEMAVLKNGDPLLTKMLLTPDDFLVFHYVPGQPIEAESADGDRIWTVIRHLETLEHDSHVILMFTLIHHPDHDPGA